MKEKPSINKLLPYVDGLYNFNELYDKGIREGDIVASPLSADENGISWHFYLLRNGFPKEFNTALCCWTDTRRLGWMHLYQIGFHWCGSLHKKFRKVTEGEKQMFVDTCVKRLYTPIETDGIGGWDQDIYEQILASLLEYRLITQYRARKIIKEVKELNGVDLKHYRQWL